MNQVSLKIIFYLSLVLAILHGLAMYFDLYFFIWWLDIPMHVLGGALVAYVACFLYQRLCTSGVVIEQRTAMYGVIFASVLFVGVAWEYFEYSKDLTFNTIGSYRMDVIKDIVMDLLGGFVAGIFLLRK
jgi:hypothetical protein